MSRFIFSPANKQQRPPHIFRTETLWNDECWALRDDEREKNTETPYFSSTKYGDISKQEFKAVQRMICTFFLKLIYFIYNGPVAQLGERLHGMQEVASSILVRSTIYNNNPPRAGFLLEMWLTGRRDSPPSGARSQVRSLSGPKFENPTRKRGVLNFRTSKINERRRRRDGNAVAAEEVASSILVRSKI